ncbi:ribonuclease H-like domain-containing protein, partial [Tanacetum coccineum]
MAFVSTPGSTNEDNTTSVQDSTASTHVSTTSTNNSTVSLSDATVYAFLANQPNGSQVFHEDLEQIHEDDLEEIDLKWQLALLSLKARNFYQRTGKKIIINGSDTDAYDKSKVECFNCHNMGHFARECRDTSSKAMVAFDGAGFDWSFMADEEVPSNLALMAFSDSGVYNHKTCSGTCLKSYETLKSQYDSLRVEFNKSEFDLATYKIGLASVEEQLVFYKKNEIEKLKKEKESNQIKIDNFENASKNLDKLIGSQIFDNNRKGVGYNAIPPPPTGLFAPPTIDLSSSGLKEFQQPEFEGYRVKVNKSVSEKSSNEIKKTTGALIIEDWVSNCDEDESEVMGTGQKEVRPVWNNALRTNHQNFSNSRRNFAPTTVLTKSGIVPISTARQRSSKAAAPLSAARPINTAAPKLYVNAAKTKPNIFQKAHSLSKRPFNQQIALNNRSLNNKINSAKINSVNTAKGKRVTSVVGKQEISAVKSSTCWVWRPKRNIVDHISRNSGSYICKPFDYDDPQVALIDTRIFDSGCARHMTGNKSFLIDYQGYDRGFVAFAGSSKGGRITSKGKIKTGKLDFEDVYFVKELKFNLFTVSQMCDKKNSVLFTKTECLILSPDFKLPDENKVMLKIPKKDNMYSFDLKNVVPSKGLTCLIAKATNDESNNWHRRLGHINFKTMNKLVKVNLVRENQSDHKVKIIRCDNETEFKNYDMNQFCGIKVIKREFSNARTPQQNGVAKRKNRTLIEAARTMLAYLLLPIPFWAEAVNTSCYVQNMVLVTKPHNKTPYELLIGRTPIISFMRPFGCPVTILNTLDHLGKFNGKADEGFLVGYSINSKAFRVFNSKTRRVEENLHVNFLENKANVAESGPEWLFDIDILTNSMNYQLVSVGNRTNGNAGLETNSDAGQAGEENVPNKEYILLQLLHTSSNVPSNYGKDESSPKDGDGKMNEVRDSAKEGNINGPGEAINTDSTNRLNTVNPGRAKEQRNKYESLFDPLIPDLEDTADLQDTGIFRSVYDDEYVGAE